MESEKTSNLDAAGNGKSGSMARGKPLGHASVQQFAGTQSPGLRRLQKGRRPGDELRKPGTSSRTDQREFIGFQRRDPDREEPANKYGWTRCPGAYEIGLANKFCFRGKPSTLTNQPFGSDNSGGTASQASSFPIGR